MGAFSRLCAILVSAPILVAISPSSAFAQPAAAANTAQASSCDRPTFRIIVDVGHSYSAAGALSARGVYEYDFNFHLASEIERSLLDAGFTNAMLMVTTEKPTAGLFARVAAANALRADLLLSIHHDAVPDRMLQTWEFDGAKHEYNDRFPGHSIFVSHDNADYAGSLMFGRMLGSSLKARGLKYTPHYVERFMGSRRRILVDAETGVYRYDQLIVLRHTQMPAVLLEAGSIVNRDEELVLASSERRELVSAAATEAVEAFCASRGAHRQTIAANPMGHGTARR
jgi:N-acetylmuramoyl-L-alanine amidase